jgi:hypothetical protein
MSNVTQTLDPATPANTAFDDTAGTLLGAIRAMREQIPFFTIPETTDANRKLARAANVPPELIDLTAAGLLTNPELVRNGSTDPKTLRQLMTFASAYSPVADELEALAQFVRHSVTVAKNQAGSEALLTYEVARRLAKRKATAGLAPLVADMRRVLRNSRAQAKSSKTKTPQPQPEPQPKQDGPAPADRTNQS